MDGRLLAFAAGGRARGPSRVIEPPILFRGEAPVEVIDRGGKTIDAAAPYHLVDFSIAPSGRFFLLQSESFPRLPRTLADLHNFRQARQSYRPRKVLTVVDRTGELLGAWRVDPYDPWEVAVTETVVCDACARRGRATAGGVV